MFLLYYQRKELFVNFGLIFFINLPNSLIFAGLKDEIRKVCAEEYLVCGEGDEQGAAWMEKVKLINILVFSLSFINFYITRCLEGYLGREGTALNLFLNFFFK